MRRLPSTLVPRDDERTSASPGSSPSSRASPGCCSARWCRCCRSSRPPPPSSGRRLPGPDWSPTSPRRWCPALRRRSTSPSRAGRSPPCRPPAVWSCPPCRPAASTPAATACSSAPTPTSSSSRSATRWPPWRPGPRWPPAPAARCTSGPTSAGRRRLRRHPRRHRNARGGEEAPGRGRVHRPQGGRAAGPVRAHRRRHPVHHVADGLKLAVMVLGVISVAGLDRGAGGAGPSRAVGGPARGGGSGASAWPPGWPTSA